MHGLLTILWCGVKLSDSCGLFLLDLLLVTMASNSMIPVEDCSSVSLFFSQQIKIVAQSVYSFCGVQLSEPCGRLLFDLLLLSKGNHKSSVTARH